MSRRPDRTWVHAVPLLLYLVVVALAVIYSDELARLQCVQDAPTDWPNK